MGPVAAITLRVLDLQVRGIGRVIGQRERRVPVGAERVVLHPPGLPEYAHVELEDRPRVTPGDHDSHHGHRAEHHEGESCQSRSRRPSRAQRPSGAAALTVGRHRRVAAAPDFYDLDGEGLEPGEQPM